jgi:antagonist of KipI
MQIELIKPGLLSTVQDLGRPAFRSLAVPVGGAMDRLAIHLANAAIGNAARAAVIEFTYAAASFVALSPILIAYAGGGAVLNVGTLQLPAGCPLFIPKGTEVHLSHHPLGCRTYLAVAGGWEVPEVLGSKSTYLTAKFGGHEGRKLKAGDRLNHTSSLTSFQQKMIASLVGDQVNYPNWRISDQFAPQGVKTIRVVPAEEFTRFKANSIVDFLSLPFTVTTESNRMGYQLSGSQIHQQKVAEMLSTAVTFGTIQVTGNGNLVILMADGQTTGGYPRIAQVAAVDLPLCAQLKLNDQIYFEEISRKTAETLYLNRAYELQKLRAAIALKFS